MKFRSHTAARWLLALSLGALAVVSTPLASKAADQDNAWHLTFTPYLWAPTINGSFRFQTPNGNGNFGVLVGPNQYLSHLNSGALFAIEAQKNRLVLGTDVVYLNVNSSASVTDVHGPGGNIRIPITADATLHFAQTIWTLEAGWVAAQSPKGSLQLIGGLRQVSATPTTTWNLTGPFGDLTASGGARRDFNVSDPIIGVRGQYNLDKKWFVPYYFDYGLDSGNQTNQYVIGVGYRANKYGDLMLVQRQLAYYPNSGAVAQLKLSGPAIAYAFHL